jgi:POT family proton-dependent oligopeptide transporter
MSQESPAKPAVTESIPVEERSSLFDHPIGFWFFFWGELAERCSYYGMRAILLLYMIDRLGFSEGQASANMSYFIAACYLLPLAGGYVADNYFGKYRTIVGFSLPYILGHVILGIESVPFLVVALGLLAMGTGVIKPNISTLMGMTYDQQRPGQTRLRSDAFAMFYGAINIGAALSSFAMPWIRTHYGYQIAFLFPAALMVVAFLVFASGKPFYAEEKIERKSLTREERYERLVVLGRIFGLFLVVTFFWSIFDQSASTWTLFARDHLDLHFLGWTLDADSIQALNPVLIVLLLPPITLFWHFLARMGLSLKPTDKMLIGFVLTAITMAIMSVAGYLAGVDGRVSVLWEVIPYVIITAAEICISVVGLELAFTAAPPSMKSFVTGCWFLTVFIGNMLNSQITPLYEKLSPGTYFGLFALVMVPVTVAFVLIARRFNRTVARLQQEQAQ